MSSCSVDTVVQVAIDSAGQIAAGVAVRVATKKVVQVAVKVTVRVGYLYSCAYCYGHKNAYIICETINSLSRLFTKWLFCFTFLGVNNT
jgi:hypothetical protein